ncbi:MAG: outer membrane protein assembly factor BamE [Acidobacteriia bacterium]|nr:outer membrane protein assembly factor BamE [Terriglobia bacterium]
MKRFRQGSWQKGCTLVIFAAVLLSTVYYFAASEDDLARLKPGMTKDAVIETMGKPDSRGEKKGEDPCGWFIYKNVGHYKYVQIWFDCQDKLVGIDKASK